MDKKFFEVRTCYSARYPRFSDVDESEEVDNYHEERLFPFPGQDEILEHEEASGFSATYSTQSIVPQVVFQTHVSAGKVRAAQKKRKCQLAGRHRPDSSAFNKNVGGRVNDRTNTVGYSGRVSAYSSRRGRT